MHCFLNAHCNRTHAANDEDDAASVVSEAASERSYVDVDRGRAASPAAVKATRLGRRDAREPAAGARCRVLSTAAVGLLLTACHVTGNDVTCT